MFIDRPASSVSDTKLAAASVVATTPTCCNCFGPKKRWSDSASTGQMSEIYCRECDNENDIDSPACLANITPKRDFQQQRKNRRNVLTIESELELPATGKPLRKDKKLSSSQKKDKINFNTPKKQPSADKSSAVAANVAGTTDCLNGKNNNKKIEEYEYADDATAFNGDLSKDNVKMGVLNELESKLMIRVQGKEELPARQTTNPTKNPNETVTNKKNKKHLISTASSVVKNNSRSNSRSRNNVETKLENVGNTKNMKGTKVADDHLNLKLNKDKKSSIKLRKPIATRKPSTDETPTVTKEIDVVVVGVENNADNKVIIDSNTDDSNTTEQIKSDLQLLADNDYNGNNNNRFVRLTRSYSTLPKMKKSSMQQQQQNMLNRPIKKFPMRTTPDGTNIYYWCDVPKKQLKGYYYYLFFFNF